MPANYNNTRRSALVRANTNGMTYAAQVARVPCLYENNPAWLNELTESHAACMCYLPTLRDLALGERKVCSATSQLACLSCAADAPDVQLRCLQTIMVVDVGAGTTDISHVDTVKSGTGKQLEVRATRWEPLQPCVVCHCRRACLSCSPRGPQPVPPPEPASCCRRSAPTARRLATSAWAART